MGSARPATLNFWCGSTICAGCVHRSTGLEMYRVEPRLKRFRILLIGLRLSRGWAGREPEELHVFVVANQVPVLLMDSEPNAESAYEVPLSYSKKSLISL